MANDGTVKIGTELDDKELLKDLKQVEKSAKKTGEKAGKAFSEVAQESGKAASEVSSDAKKISKEYSEQTDKIKKNAKDSFSSVERESKKATEKVSENAKKAGDSSDKESGKSSSGWKKAFSEIGSFAQKGFGVVAGAAAAAGAAVAAAAVGIGTAALKFGDDFQRAANGLQASTGTMESDMDDLKKSMENIYNNNFGEDFEDIADSMATVKQQMKDLNAEELEKVTTDAIMLRDTFEFDVAESIRAVNMLVQQFGISGEEAYNLIAQGAQAGLNKNDDLLDSINEYAVHYAQLGFDAEDFFHSLESGTAAGTFSVDKLGDAMKEFGIRVKDGSDSSREAFEYLGYDADKMFETFNKGGKEAAEMTQILIDELTGMPDSVEKTTAGVALFGTMWEDLGAEGIKALGDLNGQVSLSKDALEQINSVKYSTLGEAITGIGRNLQTKVFLPISDSILPAMNEFANSFAKAEGASEMLSVVQEGIGSALTFITEQSPSWAEAGVGLMTQLVNGIASGFPELFNKAVEAVVSFAMSLTDPATLTNLINAGLNLITSLVHGITTAMPKLFEAAPVIIANLVVALINSIPSLASAALQIMTDLGVMMIRYVGYMLSAIPDIIAKVKDKFASTDWSEVGKNIIEGIKNGIKSAAGRLVDAAVQAAKDAVEAVKEWLGIASPSKLMRDLIGKNMIAGITVGIKDETPNMLHSSAKTVKRLVDGMKEASYGVYPEYRSGRSNKGDTERTEGAGGVVNNYIFNQPVETPDETARAIRKVNEFGLAGE